MNNEIKRATGLLVIEAVNSNPNGDPDRESDPRRAPMAAVKSLRSHLNASSVICWRIMTHRFSKLSPINIPKTPRDIQSWCIADVKKK